MSGIDKAVRAVLTVRGITVSSYQPGEIAFSLAIEPGSFLGIRADEVFEGILPADLIREQVLVRCQLITSESPASALPAGCATLYCELPVGPIAEKDSTLLACVLNEFNSTGIAAGCLFYDTSDNSVYYRQYLDLQQEEADEHTRRAIQAMLNRAENELTYTIQGMVIFKRKVHEARDQIKQSHAGKVVPLFPSQA